MPSLTGSLDPIHPDIEYDLVCIGFGPASLAIAVAIHDLKISARVLFLERQRHFAWHAGMLLPGAKMQISFLKDLATFRNPCSKFTFINYLKSKNRLEAFANLGTFLPLREEFNDYFTWVADQFKDQVQYSTEVTSIAPTASINGCVHSWSINASNVQSSRLYTFTARHIVVAIGGQPKIPDFLQNLGPAVIHSSQYLTVSPRQLKPIGRTPRFAIIGGGQSSAEIFDDLTTKHPDAQIHLYTSSSALKPSDDSPL
jgi:L-ornithine N5-monooxygenase